MAGQGQSRQGSGDAQSIAVRPLSKGMNTKIAAQLLESGAGCNVQGLAVEPLGLTGLPGLKPLIDSPSTFYGKIPFAFADEVVQALHTFYTSAGAQELLAITNRTVYRTSDLLAFTRVPWARVYTKTGLASATITINASQFLTDFVRAGQQVELTRTSTGAKELFTIQSVTDATHIVLTVAPPNGPYNNNFNIYDTFAVSDPYVVQYAPATGAIYFVDYTTNGIRKYAGSMMTKLDTHNENGAAPTYPAPFTGASSIAYIGGRLLVGCCIEAGAEGRKTLRWSSATDLSEFSTTAYTVFANDAGEILGIRALEDYPVILLGTGAYAGTPYGFEAADTDPWTFRRLETGGRNACSPRGLTSVPNGVVYVAKNAICAISSLKRTEKGEFTLDSLECPVLRDSLNASTHKTAAIAFYDTHSEAVVFGFFDTFTEMTDLWFYFLRTKEWSHRGTMPFRLSAITDLSVSASTTWAQAGALGSWASVAQRSWRSFLADFSVSHMTAADTSGIVYVLDESRGYDTYVNTVSNTTRRYAIQHVYETGDLDFGAPDDTKVVHAFALRISGEKQRTQRVDFTLEASANKGRQWRSLGIMHIDPTEDEEELHFRMSGTNIRFRISFLTDEVPFTLEEYTLRVRLAGAQILRGAD